MTGSRFCRRMLKRFDFELICFRFRPPPFYSRRSSSPGFSQILLAVISLVHVQRRLYVSPANAADALQDGQSAPDIASSAAIKSVAHCLLLMSRLTTDSGEGDVARIIQESWPRAITTPTAVAVPVAVARSGPKEVVAVQVR